MSKFFEVKVKYQSVDQSGKNKTISESYILDAVSHTDAETRINEELEPIISGEFSVKNIKASSFSEIILNEDSKFFKCKLVFIALDEERGTERKHSTSILVSADNVKGAYEKLDESMKDTVSAYSIDGVVVSPIVDYFPMPKKEEEINKEAE